MMDCSFEYCIIEVKLKHENVLLCSGYRALTQILLAFWQIMKNY